MLPVFDRLLLTGMPQNTIPLRVSNPYAMNSISGFTFDEYLTIFNALIYGHITSYFFTGWSSWIQNRKKIIFNVRHVAFTGFVFVMIVNNWWVTYGRINAIIDRQALFFLSLLVPINLFILTVNLFPRLDREIVDLSDSFVKRERRIYLLLALNFLLNLLVSQATQEIELFHQENIFRMIGVAICMVSLFLRKPIVYDVSLLIGFGLLSFHTGMQGDPPDSHGFSFVEYITIYSTFFFGYLAYIFLTGWAYIVQQIQRINFGKEYFLWTLLAFGLLIDVWWGSWEREPYASSHLGYFLLSLTTPMIFYVLAMVMFPVMKNGDQVDLRDYFRRNERIIYFLFAMIFVTNSLIAISMEEETIYNGENIFRIVAIALAMINFLSRSIWVHRCVLTMGWVVLILHIIIY